MSYDRKGKLLRGGEDEATDEIWVLERFVSGDNSMSLWRFCGKLDYPAKHTQWKRAIAKLEDK